MREVANQITTLCPRIKNSSNFEHAFCHHRIEISMFRFGIGGSSL